MSRGILSVGVLLGLLLGTLLPGVTGEHLLVLVIVVVLVLVEMGLGHLAGGGVLSSLGAGSVVSWTAFV